MSVALTPCPFCGDVAEFERTGTPRQSCIVQCTECGARHESNDEGERSGTSWNRRAADAEIARLTAELAQAARAFGLVDRERTEAAACREEARRALLDVGIALGVDVPPLDEIEPVRANWQRYAAATVAAAKATAAARAVPPDVEASKPATVGGLLTTDNPHPGGCHTVDAMALRNCASDGHHECRTCTRREVPDDR